MWCCFKRQFKWPFKISLAFHSSVDRNLNSSIMSRNRITSLVLEMVVRRLDACFDQILRTRRRVLNFRLIHLPRSLAWTGYCQKCFTRFSKSLCSIQWFSNLKVLALGIEELISITQGTWSETDLARGKTKVLGKRKVQLFEVKNQSSFSNRGSSCILLQVKDRPFRGNSTKPKTLMTSSKRNMSLTLPPGLFLFEGDLVKLKSPTINQSWSGGIWMFVNQSRNLPLSSVLGACKDL